MRTSVRLALQPTLFERGYRLLGRGAMLSIFASIALAVFIGFSMIVSLPFDDAVIEVVSEPRNLLAAGLQNLVSVTCVLLWRSKLKTLYPR